MLFLKLTITSLVILFTFVSQIYANPHSHDGRNHTHSLPVQGIAHQHNNGALGRATQAYQKSSASNSTNYDPFKIRPRLNKSIKKVQLVKHGDSWVTWVPDQSGCFHRVIAKSITWNGGCVNGLASGYGIQVSSYETSNIPSTFKGTIKNGSLVRGTETGGIKKITFTGTFKPNGSYNNGLLYEPGPKHKFQTRVVNGKYSWSNAIAIPNSNSNNLSLSENSNSSSSSASSSYSNTNKPLSRTYSNNSSKNKSVIKNNKEPEWVKTLAKAIELRRKRKDKNKSNGNGNASAVSIDGVFIKPANTCANAYWETTKTYQQMRVRNNCSKTIYMNYYFPSLNNRRGAVICSPNKTCTSSYAPSHRGKFWTQDFKFCATYNSYEISKHFPRCPI